jgi:hypothetical protein
MDFALLGSIIVGVGSALGGLLAGKGASDAGESLAGAIDSGITAMVNESVGWRNESGIWRNESAMWRLALTDASGMWLRSIEVVAGDAQSTIKGVAFMYTGSAIFTSIISAAAVLFAAHAVIESAQGKGNVIKAYAATAFTFARRALFWLGATVLGIRLWFFLYFINRETVMMLGCFAAALMIMATQVVQVALPSWSWKIIPVFFTAMALWSTCGYGTVMHQYHFERPGLGWARADGVDFPLNLTGGVIRTNFKTFEKTGAPAITSCPKVTVTYVEPSGTNSASASQLPFLVLLEYSTRSQTVILVLSWNERMETIVKPPVTVQIRCHCRRQKGLPCRRTFTSGLHSCHCAAFCAPCSSRLSLKYAPFLKGRTRLDSTRSRWPSSVSSQS